MKFAAAVLALAKANPEWLIENWWESAQEVYSWASANPSDFRAAAMSMGNRYDALWNFCNADGSAEVSGAEFTACAASAANHFGKFTPVLSVALKKPRVFRQVNFCFKAIETSVALSGPQNDEVKIFF